MSLPQLAGENAKACWDAIRNAPASEQHLGHLDPNTNLPGYTLYGCLACVFVRGWVIIPYIDCGEWDYVDVVVSPDHVVYTVEPAVDDDCNPIDDERRKVFNWEPSVAPDSCPRDRWRHGLCWDPSQLRNDSKCP